MGDQIHDIPESNVTRMDFIVETVQRELAGQAKMAGLLTDVSEFAEPGRKSVSFPKLGSFAVQKLGQNQRADAQVLTATEDQLELDQHATVQWIMKKRTSLQSMLNWDEALISRAASAHAREFDKDCLDELIDNAAAANNITYNASDVEANILSIVEKLDTQSAPEEGRFVLFRPAQKKLLLQVANFVQADRYGSNVPVLTGELGQAYGLRFVLSNIQSDSFVDGVMVGFHKEALAYAFQMDPEYGEQDALEYGVGSKRAALDQLYGVKSVQGGVLTAVVS